MAQDSRVDSLKKIMATAPPDSNKVKAMVSLGSTYYDSDPSQAIKIGMDAKQLAESIGFRRGMGMALKVIGKGNDIQGKYVEALTYYQQALAAFDSVGDKAGVANMFNNIGTIYFNQGDDANALEYYLKSLKVAEGIKDTLRIATALINIGGVYSNKLATRDKALDYYLRALPLCEKLNDIQTIGIVTVNLGELYSLKGDGDKALNYFFRSAKVYENSDYQDNLPYTLNDIGKEYNKRGEYEKAIFYQQRAYEFSKKLDAQRDMAISLLGLGGTYYKKGDNPKALSSYREALELAQKVTANYELKEAYEGLAVTYEKVARFDSAYKYRTLYASIKDTIYNIDTDKKLSNLLFNFEIEKKQGQIDLLEKDKALQDLDLARQKFAKNASLIGLSLILIIAFILLRMYKTKVRTNRILDKQKAEIETLLLNILPQEIVTELERDGQTTPKYYESVSVLFTDFKGFTSIAEGLSPLELVAELTTFFTAFDAIIEKFELEKIKTIGDSYMCAGGVPISNEVHPVNIIKAGLAIQEYMNETNKERLAKGLTPWGLRVGIHTGPVIAGVVGRKKYAYDIWGSTVNIASRMESNGEPGKVNISAATFNLVKGRYSCAYRGKISAKNIGEIDMYFVEHETDEPVGLSTNY